MGITSEFTCDPNNFQVTPEMTRSFNELGYFIVRGLLSKDELAKIKTAVEHERFLKHGYGLEDCKKKENLLVMWKHPGNDVTGMLARCEKVAGTCEKKDLSARASPSQIDLSLLLLGGEVYHYHTKLMCKAPVKGGELFWHQDYGYWYKNGCLFPDLMSVFIPIDKCAKESGCLQILEKSHLCGRIEHIMKAGQTGADLDRVEELKKMCPHKYVEMEGGDAIFFHCNVLHTSSANTSDNKRWALIPAFNRKSNNPIYQHHHPQYRPLQKVPDSSIMSCDNLEDLSDKEFNVPEEDRTVTVRGH